VDRLEAALALYRGDFLDGEPAGDWHVEHRDRLQRLYGSALLDLGHHFARTGQHARAVDAYERALQRDEFDEAATLALMRSLDASGERARALRTYLRFAERLERELHAKPRPELTRLFLELRR